MSGQKSSNSDAKKDARAARAKAQPAPVVERGGLSEADVLAILAAAEDAIVESPARVAEHVPAQVSETRKPAAQVSHAKRSTTVAAAVENTNEPQSDDSDNQLEAQLIAALAGTRIRAFRRISISVLQGVVTLRGEVGSIYTRELLLHTCGRISGVKKLYAKQLIVREEVLSQRRFLDVFESFDFRFRVGTPAVVTASLLMVVIGVVCTWAGNGSGRETLYPAKGQVVFDGEAAPGAVVQLHPFERTVPLHPRAVVGGNGSFQLGTYAEGDGAPAGEYRVTIVWTPVTEIGGEAYSSPNVLPSRYSNPATSPLTIKVIAGNNEFPTFHLTTAK